MSISKRLVKIPPHSPNFMPVNFFVTDVVKESVFCSTIPLLKLKDFMDNLFHRLRSQTTSDRALSVFAWNLTNVQQLKMETI